MFEEEDDDRKPADYKRLITGRCQDAERGRWYRLLRNYLRDLMKAPEQRRGNTMPLQPEDKEQQYRRAGKRTGRGAVRASKSILLEEVTTDLSAATAARMDELAAVAITQDERDDTAHHFAGARHSRRPARSLLYPLGPSARGLTRATGRCLTGCCSEAH